LRSGMLAEFESPEKLLRAYEALQRAGFTRLTSFTPYPVKGLVKKLPPSMVPWIMLGAGLFGGGFGYLLQWWCNARAYAINVGGRPLNSAPAFIPITFESSVLGASLAGFFVLLAFCGLPRLYHPVFEVPGFERATVDRFWLGVDDADPRYTDLLGEELVTMGALRSVRLKGAR
jgi:hypothetical protein